MMSTQLTGIHHITLCPGNAQQDLDFFTQVLGQRLVKQTVLMDGRIPIYHLYYGNADADIGSIATTFPYARKPGRAGSGQLSCTSYTVPKGATTFASRNRFSSRRSVSGRSAWMARIIDSKFRGAAPAASSISTTNRTARLAA